jgi:N-acetylglucosaminyldiphosphoundecaprenol N-acetyl-beta-D-mannosaminyltransferase
MSLERGQVIGLPVMAADMASITGAIVDLAGRGQGGHVCVANTHMLTTARGDAQLRATMEDASLVVSDGLPLVWQLRRHGFRNARQVRGPDLFLEVCRAAAKAGLPVYFFGGDERLIADLTARLRRDLPQLAIAGAEAPPVLPSRPVADADVVARLRDSGARIVFVGLGCPKQELWMQAYRPHLGAVLIGVGQAFAIAAGHLGEAPPWIRRIGLEWLYRLASEPRRLWRRYLVSNSLFLALVMGEELRGMLHGRRVSPT